MNKMKREPITIRLSEQAQARLDAMLEREPWLNRSSAIEKMILSYKEDTGMKTSYYIQQGSTADLRVSHQDKWFVEAEDSDGKYTHNVRIVSGPFDSEQEAIDDRDSR